MKNIIEHFPVKTFALVIFVWILIALGNYWAHTSGNYPGTGILFPFSVIYPSNFLMESILYGVLFLAIGIFSYLKIENINKWALFFICVLMVFLGNMMQGNIDIAFLQPFYYKGRQYYTDAIAIQDWVVWLRDFTLNQENFQLHTRTHPPFTTLIHYWILELFGGSILGLSLTFFAFSMLSIFLFYEILGYFNFKNLDKKRLILLFSIIPSFNIYSLVSIDGLVLTLTLGFLLSVSRIMITNKIGFFTIILGSATLIGVNLLSFSGLFLFAFAGLLCLWGFYTKKYVYFKFLLILIINYVLYFYAIYYLLDYNHYEVFYNASKMENPNGFILLHDPKIYFATRLEDICEILLFLSFGYTALLFSKNKAYFPMFQDKNINILFFCAVIALMTMFLTGAYGTGETARACLFIAPFFILLLKNIHHKTLSILYFLCLFQTFGMQMIGNFYW